MAITKIRAIKSTLAKALAYIENPHKTDDAMLVSGCNCDPFFASSEFEMTATLARRMKGDYTKADGADVLAYHMIQSFAPFDPLTPEQAHQLGKQWADAVLEGKYEYVITTHIDKGQIHNHIIFNATSFYDYRKFESVPFKTVARLRQASDRLCAENGLYVAPPQGRGCGWKEHWHRQNGTSWKVWLQRAIDKYIDLSSDFDDMLRRMEADGFSIKRAKYTSYKIPGQEDKHFTGGPSLGKEYAVDRIRARIAKRIEAREQSGADSASVASYGQEIEYRSRRGRLAETKELAETLLTIRRESIKGYSEFDARVSTLWEEAAPVKRTLFTLDAKNLQYKNAAKYLLTYRKYLSIRLERDTLKPGSRKYFAFEGKYEGELQSFAHAAAQLEKLGFSAATDPDELLSMIREQDAQAAELSGSLNGTEARIQSLRRAQNVVERVMGAEETGRREARER